jgi:RNA polymerase sigma-70 factor, ECF subfamily
MNACLVSGLARTRPAQEPAIRVSTATKSPPVAVPDPTLSIPALAARAKGGDRGAFAGLVRELQEPLYFAVLRFTRNPDDARDIVQKSFLKAWTGLSDLESPERFRSWIFSIGLNLARNHLRDAGKRQAEPVDNVVLAAGGKDAVAMIDDRQRREHLRSALANLPDKQRECVTLRIDAELGFREIGELVGCSEGSARVNFHHGMKRLRALIAAEETP